jgi:hypothetical protein
MTWGKEDTMIPPNLAKELEKVRKAAPPPPPKDEPIYKFLEEVYRLRCRLETSPGLKKAIIKEHAALHARTIKNYARVIMELTAPGHTTVKMKHKYVTALEYAFKEGVEPKDLVEFIKEQGGLNKCGELWKNQGGPTAKRS